MSDSSGLTRSGDRERGQSGRYGAAAWILIVALSCAATLWSRYLGTIQPDDAYIFFRYARNLAAGNGFSFNPGERVEGVSSVLFTLALVPFAALPLDAVARVIAACCGLAVLLVLPGLSARMRGHTRPDVVDWFPSILLGTNPAFAFWSSGPMETVPFTLLVVLLLRSHLDEGRDGPGWRSALVAVLASLTRPETPLLLLAVVLEMLPGFRRDAFKRLRWLGVVLGCFAVFLCFRWFYFGDWLPNTYYAKAGESFNATIDRGWKYDLRFFATLVPSVEMSRATRIGLCLGLLAVLLVYRSCRRRPRPVATLVLSLGVAVAVGAPVLRDYLPTFRMVEPVRSWLGLGLVAVALAHGFGAASRRPVASMLLLIGAAVTFNGGDWILLWRFWIPGLPLLYLLLTSWLRRSFDGFRAGQAAMAALVALMALHSVHWGMQERRLPNGALNPINDGREALGRIGNYLSEHSRPGNLVALMDIGRIGYETQLPIVDISGLVDRRIARSSGGFLHKQFPVRYVLDRDPRFFVLVDGYPIDSRIARDPAFVERYERVHDILLATDRRAVIYERKARHAAAGGNL